MWLIIVYFGENGGPTGGKTFWSGQDCGSVAEVPLLAETSTRC